MINTDRSILNNKLTDKEKENYIKSIRENNLELFISYLFGNEAREPYDIFEEISEPGYKWIIFHYVMHYGKWEIIRFIIEYLTDLNLLEKALKMKTSDNNCPMLCLLKSNNLQPQKKKEIYFKIINTFNIPISDEVIIEANKRNFYDENENPEDNDILKDELFNNKISEDKNILKNELFKNKIAEDKNILKNELTTDEKMKFYNSVIAGNLEEFKGYINGTNTRKPYNIFEEVSVPGYKWTTFHYAMHYGKWEIIKYIFEYLINLNLLDKALNIKSKDNRCPILCLLKSNALSYKEKLIVFSNIVENFDIPIRREVKKELINRSMEDLINKHN